MENKKYPIEETFVWLIALPFIYWRWIVFPFLAYIILVISYIFWWHSYYSPLHKITKWKAKSEIVLYINERSRSIFELDSMKIHINTNCFVVTAQKIFKGGGCCGNAEFYLHLGISHKRYLTPQTVCPDSLPIKYEIFGKYDSSTTAVLTDSTVIYFE